ncbi:MAG: Eco57I restriction-modification methylase domain-containing protein [Candidatus Hodarchaeota archaeon]
MSRNKMKSRRTFTSELLEWVLKSAEYLLNNIMDELGFSSLSSASRSKVLASSFEPTKTLFYRILLILYAEISGLLPLEHPLYYKQSLTRILETISEQDERGIYLLLNALFDQINHGSEELSLSAYPGKLFQSDFQPFSSGWYPKNEIIYEILNSIKQESFLNLSQNDFMQSLADFHSRLLEYVPSVSSSSTIEIRHRKKLRHKKGTFYTPKIITQYIVDKTLEPLVRGKSTKELLSLKVLDPTMGCGNFLLETCSYIAQAYCDANIKEGLKESPPSVQKHIAENCLFGIDLDPLAVELTKFALWVMVGSDQELDAKSLNQHLVTGNCFSHLNLPSFDAVIVNPPYVDVNKEDYRYTNFRTLDCRNLYPYVLEISLQFSKNGGRIGTIIPISITCAKRMQPLRALLQEKCSDLWIASFGIRPSKIFSGIDQRVAIVFLTKNSRERAQIHTTRFLKWKKGQLSGLLANLKFENSSDCLLEGRIPRLGNTQMKLLLKSLLKSKYQIKDFLSAEEKKSPYRLYYHNVARYWIKATDFNPFFKKNGQIGTSTNIRILFLPDEETQKFIGCILNSSIFYLFWQMYSDDFHVTHFEIMNFPLNPERLSQTQHQQLCQLFGQLMTNRKEHSYVKKLKNGIEYQEFQPSYGKEILLKIDRILLQMYDFSWITFLELLKS